MHGMYLSYTPVPCHAKISLPFTTTTAASTISTSTLTTTTTTAITATTSLLHHAHTRCSSKPLYMTPSAP
eukprot:NODE_11640_length_253_cov_1.000000_g9870_i0.p2 GENE.NODE_11640_length_253_cov_1.000000_g9870_i0~~NODE_11640_length_253_cov_1.000000_g9870_i0.p2  ORF type:complete len:70 (-),score=17.56 NODE_11640_length_253_cov_1.000000_g9870_i0:4-213(-)